MISFPVRIVLDIRERLLNSCPYKDFVKIHKHKRRVIIDEGEKGPVVFSEIDLSLIFLNGVVFICNTTQIVLRRTRTTIFKGGFQ